MRPLLLVFALLAAGAASAQGRLAFEATDHDLGRLSESGEGAHTFRFTNAGDRPLRLTRVEVACGCTTPSWTETPVPPGGSGHVEVVFDPAGRPGPFEKAVFVEADGTAPVTLRVSGVVEPALAETGTRVGSLAFDRVVADLGRTGADGEVQAAFRYANVGARPVRIDSVSAPSGVRVVFPERPVFPDGVAGLFVTADARSVARLTSAQGFEIDLVLHTTDPETPDKQIRVVGVLVLAAPETHGVIHGGGE